MGQQDVKQAILALIDESRKKTTPQDLFNIIKSRRHVNRREVRRALESLVLEGELSYTYLFGTSFVERSFNRPVRVSDKIVLAPAGRAISEFDGEVIFMLHGVAFGTGSHPSTRLALQGIEIFLENYFSSHPKKGSTGLDVGTGTGVLAMAAVRLGVSSVSALDEDACAVKEARDNAALNGIAKRISFHKGPLEKETGPYTVIMANLRLPTLLDMCPDFDRLLASDGGLLLSGLEVLERDALLGRYSSAGFSLSWSKEEKGWVAVVLDRKKGGP